METNKLWYSWEEMRRDVNTLAEDLLIIIQVIVVCRVTNARSDDGSLDAVPQTSFPFCEIFLNRRLFQRNQMKSPDCDDIYDSGVLIELNASKDQINQPLELPVEVRFATLWWNNECNVDHIIT